MAVCSSSFRSNPFYEPRLSGADSSTLEKSMKRRAPQPPSAGLNPSVAPGPTPIPKTSSPEVSSTPPALAPSVLTAVIGRELASSSPKVSLPLLLMTLITLCIKMHCC